VSEPRVPRPLLRMLDICKTKFDFNRENIVWSGKESTDLLQKFICASVLSLIIQEAQLPQRDSASATHVFLGSLTDRALH